MLPLQYAQMSLNKSVLLHALILLSLNPYGSFLCYSVQNALLLQQCAETEYRVPLRLPALQQDTDPLSNIQSFFRISVYDEY